MSILYQRNCMRFQLRTFGKRVHEFYLDAIISNNFEKDLAKDDTVSQRIFKTVLYLPQQVVAVPVKGSRRMLKGFKNTVDQHKRLLERP